ncbi:hypothetical protein NFI96_020409, partial [Prochilodus magdalenae]
RSSSMETRVGLCLAALLFMNASETCSSSSVTVSLARCQLFEAGINVTSLHLNDPTCIGVIQNDRVVFSVDNSQNICGTTLRSNSTHFLYENSVQKGAVSHGLISRKSWVNINFTCAYPFIRDISLPFAIEASQSNVLFKEIQNEGPFTVQMSAYPNDSFIAPYSGDIRLDLDQQIFVSVDVTGVDEQQVSTTLEKCWATPSEDITDITRWDLIINDCPNLADGTVRVLSNGVSASAQFSFKMFTFTSMSQKIFLHCHVQMCLKNKGNCQQSCGPQVKRRRRSLNYGEPVAISMTF